MGKTRIDVDPEIIAGLLFEGGGDIHISDAIYDYGRKAIVLTIFGDQVPDCPKSVAEITQHYRTVEIKPRD